MLRVVLLWFYCDITKMTKKVIEIIIKETKMKITMMKDNILVFHIHVFTKSFALIRESFL